MNDSKPIQCGIQIEEKIGKMPLINWHPSSCDFDVDGEKWTVRVVGGVQEVWLRTPCGRDFAFSITSILEDVVPVIQYQLKCEEVAKKNHKEKTK